MFGQVFFVLRLLVSYSQGKLRYKRIYMYDKMRNECFSDQLEEKNMLNGDDQLGLTRHDANTPWAFTEQMGAWSTSCLVIAH